MGNLSNNATWQANINQIETTDQLLGGAGGPMNLGPQGLADRTQWLYSVAKGFKDVAYFNSNTAFLRDQVGYRLVVFDADNATLSFTLPDSSDSGNAFSYGFTVVFKAINVNKSQVTVQSAGTDKILDGSGFDPVGLRTKVYLGDGDMIRLTWTAQGWLIMGVIGNFDDIGGIVHRYKQLPNTLIAQGQIVNRADYPRLWEFAQTLGGSLITDTSWTSSTLNKGFFSTGNNTTTFRLPDFRAMFIRGLDLGAGIDLGRISGNAGAYEDDSIKAHSHSISGIPLQETDTDRGGGSSSFSIDNIDNTKSTGVFGGLETRPKNRGLLPLIKV